MRAAGTVPGTCTIARTRRRYADGASPIRSVNRELKLPKLEEADFHTDVGHRMLPHREQMLSGVQACLDTKLVGRDAEDGLELPDEMKRRNLYLAREVRY